MREVIDDRQRTKTTSIEERVADKVHSPQIVGREGFLDGLPAPTAAASSDPAVP